MYSLKSIAAFGSLLFGLIALTTSTLQSHVADDLPLPGTGASGNIELVANLRGW